MEISAERYVDVLVGSLERVGYGEPEVLREGRAKTLCHVFRATMEYFARPDVRAAVVHRGKLRDTARSITRMTVFGWENLPLDAMVPLNIYFTYVALEDNPKDDAADDPFRETSPLMESFVRDLLSGTRQAHPGFGSLFDFLPDLLRCYGTFSQLTMLKSTLELFQGFWIESRGFRGSPGASDYPLFLRRLNGLGDFSGAALFPVARFDEDRQFGDIVTVIAQLEPVVALVNDLFSSYKETNAEEVCLVDTICVTEGVSGEHALDRIAEDGVRAVHTLVDVVESRRCPGVLKTVHDFVRGYIRWHLCDERYQMYDLEARCEGSANAVRFRRFREIACHAGCVDLVDFHTL